MATLTLNIWGQMVNPRISRGVAAARRGRILTSLTVAFLAAGVLGLQSRSPRRELGFRCRRINTGNAGGGWAAQCHKGRAIVYMTPT